MKHLVKSLVSVVMALSVLATMCVIGISASAEDTKTYLISAKAGEVMAAGGELKAENYLDSGNGSYGGTAVIRAFKKMTDGVDVSKTTITAWIWVEDASKVEYLDIQFSSDANSIDTAKLNFRLFKANFKTGWNTFVLDPSVAAAGAAAAAGTVGYQQINGGGTTVLTAIKLVRVLTAEGPNIRVGAIYVTPAAPAPVPEVEEKEFADFTDDTKVLDDYHKTRVNADEELSLVDISTLTKGDVKYAGPSANAVKVDLSKVDSNVYSGRKGGVYTSLENPVRFNGDGKEADYVFDAWLYYEGTSNVLIIQIYGAGYETKANENNSVEYWPYRYILKDLKEGWNHIVLTLDKFTKTKESDNGLQKEGLAAMQREKTITGISFHEDQFSNCSKYTYAVADLVLCHKDYADEANKAPVKDTREYIISAKDGEEVVQGTLESADYLATGNGAYVSAGVGPRVRKVLSEAVDASKSTVTVWLYVEDPSKVAIMDIELCSDGGPDGAETNFRFGPNDLKKGWNKYVLDATKAKGQTADGSIGYQANGANMSAINFVRVHGTETANIQVGAMYLTSSEMSESSATGDAVDLAVVAVAVLFAAMAASVTVYFGKKAR